MLSAAVAIKRPKSQSQDDGDDKQVGIRMKKTLIARLEKCAEKLGMDMSPLIRMILLENLHLYEKRAEAAHDVS